MSNNEYINNTFPMLASIDSPADLKRRYHLRCIDKRRFGL